MAWSEDFGELSRAARGRECIPCDTRPTEQRSPRPIQRNPKGGMSFGRRRCCSLLTDPLRDMLWCPCGSTSRLASAQNPLPRMHSCLGDSTLAVGKTLKRVEARIRPRMREGESSSVGRHIQPVWKLRETGLGAPSPVGYVFSVLLRVGTSRCDLPGRVRICSVVVELVALRRGAPRRAAQGFCPKQVFGASTLQRYYGLTV